MITHTIANVSEDMMTYNINFKKMQNRILNAIDSLLDEHSGYVLIATNQDILYNACFGFKELKINIQVFLKIRSVLSLLRYMIIL
jgi:hypothetical protein